MSKVEPGQIGQFIGKTGQTVVCKWRGIFVGKKTPTVSSVPSTEDQLNQQQRLGKVSAFMRLFTDQVRIGWASTRRTKTPMNEAVSYHMENAVAGKYPEYYIDFKEVLISRGRGIIDGGFRSVATAGNEFSIEFSWVTSSQTQSITQPTDKLTVVLLDENFRPGKVRPLIYEGVANREDLKAKVTVYDLF